MQVAIVGGGCAGLSAAWKLREYRPVILEQASRLGGNAKGETWKSIPYSIGAAYLCKPEAGGEIEHSLKEIGAREHMRTAPHEALFLPQSQALTSLTRLLQEASSSERQAWNNLMTSLKRYAHGEVGFPYPDIPTDDETLRLTINQMDLEDFATLCERLAGGPLPKVLRGYLEQYCWTSFGASMDEISAASGVNFLVSEFDEILVAPGGNSWITEQATRRLAAEIGLSHLRVNSLVYHVEVTPEGVLIGYMDEGQKQRYILAQRAVLACPKFVVKRILNEIEPARLEAINQLKYRAYLVHQALIKGQLKDDFYELFLIGSSSGDRGRPIEERSRQAGSTDLTYGNFAAVSQEYTVLSLYQALPYASGRAQVYQDLALTEERNRILTQLNKDILPALQLSRDSLVGLRSSRWGHPLPVATPKLIHDGVVDELRKPYRDRVFFAQQDNWALPAIEVSLYEGMRAARHVKRSLASP